MSGGSRASAGETPPARAATGEWGRAVAGLTKERLVVVQSSGVQGSGYLLTQYLVLTSAHLVRGEAVILATAVGSPEPGRVLCDRLGSWWSREEGTDVALLLARSPLAGAEHFTGGRERWARLGRLSPIPDCRAVGFPYVQRDDGGMLDSEQVTGVYKPGSNLAGGGDVLAVDGTPPLPRDDGLSPWAGMSGAAVFAGDILLGVVSTDPPGWQHGRFTVSPLHPVLQRPDFAGLLQEHGYGTPSRAMPPRQPTDDLTEFEARYGLFVAKRHSLLRIYGIDLTGSKAVWPLDAAYYSIEAVPSTAAPADRGRRVPPVALGPVPAEMALAGHRKVLLRGVAGSGKTTLVQWLAVTTAQQNLGPHLQDFRDLVPFVLPLRRVARKDRLPAPDSFLSAVDAPFTAPAGWAERTLQDGRALVLVDGLDEIDERSRERVRGWLRDLLAAYSGNHWLVTSRPSAVADRWLADEDFVELTLLPMSAVDVRAFVARWHDAARRTVPDDDAEREQLDVLEGTLTDTIEQNRDLGRLATNPLMCSLICALHRDRSGAMPTRRKELYDAALAMLVGRRDPERNLPQLLSGPQQIPLLQRLAYWLVTNGQVEMDREDAVALISAALPSMPTVRETLGDGRAVYHYLRDRSGVIREPTAGAVDFVHRTFQDYLAARAAVEALDFDLMTAHAHQDQWHDVICMAVAHARPHERARLLRKLVYRGDHAALDADRLRLLAMACLEHADELDPQVYALVQERAAHLIPPRSDTQADQLASLGPMVIRLLPGPDRVTKAEARAVIRTALLLGEDAALPLLGQYARDADPAVTAPLAAFHAGFSPEQYVKKVMAKLPPEHAVTVRTEEQLRAVATVPTVRGVRLQGMIDPRVLSDLFAVDSLWHVELPDHYVGGLDFLHRFAALSTLAVHALPVSEWGWVCGRPELRTLHVYGPLPTPGWLEPATQVTALGLGADLHAKQIGAAARLFPYLRELDLTLAGAATVDLGPLAALPSLTAVRLAPDTQVRGGAGVPVVRV